MIHKHIRLCVLNILELKIGDRTEIKKREKFTVATVYILFFRYGGAERNENGPAVFLLVPRRSLRSAQKLLFSFFTGVVRSPSPSSCRFIYIRPQSGQQSTATTVFPAFKYPIKSHLKSAVGKLRCAHRGRKTRSYCDVKNRADDQGPPSIEFASVRTRRRV